MPARFAPNDPKVVTRQGIGKARSPVAIESPLGRAKHHQREGIFMAGILWAVISVLFVLWLLGFLLHFGGGLIHLILVIVVVLVVVNFLTGRGARV